MSLSKKSLAVLPLPSDHVEGMYEAVKDMTREKLAECVKRLALSHERLRAELAGATLLLDERCECGCVDVVCGECGASRIQTQWNRGEQFSVWKGPHIELIVVQNHGSDESWSWTARGWREPDEDWGADKWGWCESSTREVCESAALQFYMQKDTE